MAKPIGNAMRAIYRLFGGRFRRKRAAALQREFADCGSVIDVGGSDAYWIHAAWRPKDLTILNIDPRPQVHCPNSRYVQADALSIPFPSSAFDLAMSNSVIEHVPDQTKFASEMLRVGKRVYCQTPAKEFPVEPHCLGLFVHWLPRKFFTHFVHRYLTLYGWVAKPDREETEDFKREVQLLTRRDLERLFPGCAVRVERFLGWPKSYVVTGRVASSASTVMARRIEQHESTQSLSA